MIKMLSPASPRTPTTQAKMVIVESQFVNDQSSLVAESDSVSIAPSNEQCQIHKVCMIQSSATSIINNLLFVDDEQYLMKYCFNLFQKFRSPELDDEYSEFSVQQRSFPIVLIYAIFFFVSLILSMLAPFSMEKTRNYHQFVFGLDIIVAMLSWINCFLFFFLVYRQTKHCSNSNNFLANITKRKSSIIHYCLIITITLSYCLRLIVRTMSGCCDPSQYKSGFPFLAEWNCNPYHQIGLLPMDSAVALMFTPIAYPAIFRECRLHMVVSSLLLIVITFILSSFLLESSKPLYIVSIYVVLCAFIGIDCPRQSLISFLAHKKYQQASLENQKMAHQTEVEMRHVLGNVAHDFKTPLSSFMNGVDVMNNCIDDFESLVNKRNKTETNTRQASDNLPSVFGNEFHEFVDTMRSTLHDVRSTNSFMLMTINRCLDFTKVSKGMKLTPKLETIDLIEAIAMPINCMRNVQTKMTIQLADVGIDICSHVITDMQWLQENVLCLLSNAVKYSSEGEVTLTLTLQKYRNGSDSEGGESPKHKTKGLAARDDNLSEMMELGISRMTSRNTFTREISSMGENSSLKTRKKFISSTSAAMGILSSISTHVTSSVYSSSSSRQYNPAKVIPIVQNEQYLAPQEEDSINLHSIHSTGSQNASKIASLRRAQSLVAQQNKGYLLIEVEDHGIGISDEAMKELFSPFKQTQRLAGGTGLGLFSLAKRIEALQGSYGVKKRKDGQKGSLFWFSFPYRPDMMLAKSRGDGYARSRVPNIISPLHRSRDFNHEEEICKDAIDENGNKIVFLQRRECSGSIKFGNESTKLLTNNERTSSFHSLKVKQSSDVQSTTTSSPGGRKTFDVLLAEDSPTIAKMVKLMLTRHGHKVTIAENGEVVLKHVRERQKGENQPFDVILMDLQMPVMDGLEATRRLRILEETNDDQTLEVYSSLRQPLSFKIIGLSANSDEETAQQAFDAGLNSFIPKPFDLESFYTVMEELSGL